MQTNLQWNLLYRKLFAGFGKPGNLLLGCVLEALWVVLVGQWKEVKLLDDSAATTTCWVSATLIQPQLWTEFCPKNWPDFWGKYNYCKQLSKFIKTYPAVMVREGRLPVLLEMYFFTRAVFCLTSDPVWCGSSENIFQTHNSRKLCKSCSSRFETAHVQAQEWVVSCHSTQVHSHFLAEVLWTTRKKLTMWQCP